jgi:hypothetical protein
MGRWGLLIAPTSKRTIGESFTGQVWWTPQESDESSLEVSQGPDKSGGGLWSSAGASGILSQNEQV